MRYTQSPPLNDQYHEHDVDASDLDGERASSDRVRWLRPGTTHRSGDPFTSDRPSIPRRVFRALARFFFAALIGVGATLAWQSYGDEAEEMVRARAPSLGWLLPLSTTNPPALAVTSAEMQEQLKPMAIDLAIVRRSIEQFAANIDQLARKQEEMARNVATLQAAEQQLSQKVSLPPSRPVHVPPPKPPQPPEQ